MKGIGDSRARTARHIAASPCHAPTLVIGYGNELRGDDAVGQRVAAAVEQWALPGVRAIAVHQLTPELAEALAAADEAIFVDADLAIQVEAFRVRVIEPADMRAACAHSCDPRALLALAQAVYGRAPRAWWVTIPARDLALGANLSPETCYAAAAALRWIRSQLERNEPCTRLG